MAAAVSQELGNHLTEQALVASGVTDAKKTYEALEYMLKRFRSLECSACREHFGYASRSNPSVKFCSAQCLQNGQSDQENEAVAVIEKSLGDVKSNIARLPLTPTPKNLDVMTNGMKDVKIAEVVRKPEPVKPKEDIKGSNASLASGRSGSGAARDVTDNASSIGTQSSSAALPKPIERKPFAAAAAKPSVLPVRAVFASRATSPPQKTSAANDVAKAPEPLLPAPVMTRPKAVPATTPASATVETRRMMVSDVLVSENLYNNQQVVIQFVYAPNKFTISALADESRIDEVQSDIAKYRKTNPAVKTDLVRDEVVFAKYVAEDGSEEYYRAVVTNLVGNNKYKVNFVDYGDSREVAAADCFEPSKEIMKKHRFYGIMFTLKNTADQELSMAELESTGYGLILSGEVFILESSSNSGMNWTGDLFFSGNKTSLTKHLREANEQIKPKAALSAPKAPEPAAKAQPVVPRAPEPETKVAPSPAPVVETPVVKKSMESRYSLIKTNPFLKPVESKLKPGKRHSSDYSSNISNGARVTISYVWTNNKVTVQSEADLAKIEELGKLLSKCIKPENKVQEVPEVGDIVIAPYENSGYRARVDSVEKDIIVVTFVDDGASAKVKFDECYEVDEEIIKHPFYGRICKLKMIPDDLPDVSNPELEEALGEFMTLEAHKTDQPMWEVILKINETRNYNKLVLKALSE